MIMRRMLKSRGNYSVKPIGSLRSGWLTKDMVHSIKSGNRVLNPKLLSEFNSSIGHVVKSAVDKPKDVTDKALAENECVQFVCLVW
nr:hypothetical protein [Tanacetum cinerariifolium]